VVARQPLVGVDGGRLGTTRPTGTETYSDHIVRHLLALDLPVQWRVYLNAAPTSELARELSIRAEVRAIPAPRLWTHGRLSTAMMGERPALLFVPSHVIPLVHPASVVTIHDLGYRWFPEAHPRRQRLMLDLTTRWNARAARHVIVPSAATRNDLVRFHGIDGAKVTVIHHGVSERFGFVDHGQVDALRVSLDLDGPYILTVGTIHPRKNLETVARAIAMLRADGLDCTLVVSGKRGWLADEVLDRLLALDLGSSLRLLDYVAGNDLPALYAGAACYVQPSLFEGFGMPVVEAMASGVPVLVANTSSLPEIGGDGVGLFEPLDVKGLAMAARATARSRHFTWHRAAEQTAAVLLDTLG
jgi:glycosyltransferase involved in cell wall biosynthesis